MTAVSVMAVAALAGCESSDAHTADTTETTAWWDATPTAVVTVPATTTTTTTPPTTEPAAVTTTPPTTTPPSAPPTIALYAAPDPRAAVEEAYHRGVQRWLDCYAAPDGCDTASFAPYFSPLASAEINTEFTLMRIGHGVVERLNEFRDEVVDVTIDPSGTSAVVRSCRLDPTRVVQTDRDGVTTVVAEGNEAPNERSHIMELGDDLLWRLVNYTQIGKPGDRPGVCAFR